MNESQIEQTQQGEEMNIGEVVYQETEYLQSLVPFDRIRDVAASLGRIEVAVNKRIAELEQSYAAGLEAKCPHTLRRVVIDNLNEYVGDISDRLGEANETIAELKQRIAELESALATLMDEYLCQNGFDAHHDAAAAVALNPREKEEK